LGIYEVLGSFPDTLKEYYSNRYFTLVKFDFKSKICFAKISNNQLYFSEQPGANFVTILSKVGGVTSIGSLCGRIQFHYELETYYYKIGLIPQTTGVFSVGFLMPVDLHGFPDEQINLTKNIELETSNGRKKIPVYEAFFFIINNGVTHFDLFTKYCRAGSVEDPKAFKNVFAEQKGTFTFRVVE